MESASIEDHLLFVEVDVVGGQTAVNYLVLVELKDGFPYFDDQTYQLAFLTAHVHLLVQ